MQPTREWLCSVRRAQPNGCDRTGHSLGSTKRLRRGKLLVRIPEINEGDVLRGKRSVVIEKYHQFDVVEEDRGDGRRKDQEGEKCAPKRGEDVFGIDHRLVSAADLHRPKRSRNRESVQLFLVTFLSDQRRA